MKGRGFIKKKNTVENMTAYFLNRDKELFCTDVATLDVSQGKQYLTARAPQFHPFSIRQKRSPALRLW